MCQARRKLGMRHYGAKHEDVRNLNNNPIPLSILIGVM